MNRFHLGIAASLAAIVAFSAPAAAERIRLVNVNGYSVIDSEHLVLNGGPRHHYLVTLRSSCPGMRSGVQVGLSFPSTTTLYTPFLEYVYTQDDDRCFIDTIVSVDSIDAARALIEERAAAKAADDMSDTAAPETNP